MSPEESLRTVALRLRRFLALEHYRISAHDFIEPWPRDCPYCVVINTPLPRNNPSRGWAAVPLAELREHFEALPYGYADTDGSPQTRLVERRDVLHVLDRIASPDWLKPPKPGTPPAPPSGFTSGRHG